MPDSPWVEKIARAIFDVSGNAWENADQLFQDQRESYLKRARAVAMVRDIELGTVRGDLAETRREVESQAQLLKDKDTEIAELRKRLDCVDTNQLWTERTDMPKWSHTLDLKDVWNVEDWVFEQLRDQVVKRIKASPWYDEDDYQLEYIVSGLSTTEDVEEFDGFWDQFYDWCDFHRVWVATSF